MLENLIGILEPVAAFIKFFPPDNIALPNALFCITF